MQKTSLVVTGCIAALLFYALPTNANELERIRINREMLKSQMKDPDSVQFNVETLIEKEGRTAICGKFNAKNSFGGYIGYQRWIGLAPFGVIAERGTKNFETYWNKACTSSTNSSKPKEHLPLSR